MKQLSIAFVILGLSFIWCFLKLQSHMDKNSRLETTISQQNKEIDSLTSEIFVLEIQNFRLQRAVEIFEEKNPEASSQLSDIISDETE